MPLPAWVDRQDLPAGWVRFNTWRVSASDVTHTFSDIWDQEYVMICCMLIFSPPVLTTIEYQRW